jgi:Methyltransferase domain
MRKQADEVAAVLGDRSRPDITWISRVAGCGVGDARRAVDEIAEHSATLTEVAGGVMRTGRTYYAQFPAPIELYTFVRLLRPERMIESGVASGISSAFLLLGAEVNSKGTLHSVDLPVSRKPGRRNESWAIPAGLASGWAVPARLRKRWDLRLGRSEDLMEQLLEEIGTVDLYCHDSPVDSRHFEFEMKALTKHLGPGSLVVADNTDWGVFEDTARSVGAEAVRRRHSSLGAFRVPAADRA